MIFSVSEFNEFINGYLESVGEIIVEGEISEIKISQDKWIFITIKDKFSSLSIFSFVWQIKNLSSLTEGMLVKVQGTPRLHKKSGKFSLQASEIMPSGEGALRLAFEQLKKKLEMEGLFEISRKRSLVRFPEKIGLLTAKNSKAYSDFIKVLRERMGGMKVYFYPVQVQGKDAPDSIIEGLDFFNQHISNLDFIVLTRGGGSLEDLQAFNDEQVVRKIFSSKIPVVSAVGHEADVSLTDLVADLRASTPSNAAELVVYKRKEILDKLELWINSLSEKLEIEIDRKINLTESVYTLSSRFTHNLELKVAQNSEFLTQKVNFLLQDQEKKLINLERLLKSLDYRNILKRGYSVTFFKDKVLRDINLLGPKEKIKTMLYNGTIISKVKQLKHD